MRTLTFQPHLYSVLDTACMCLLYQQAAHLMRQSKTKQHHKIKAIIRRADQLCMKKKLTQGDGVVDLEAAQHLVYFSCMQKAVASNHHLELLCNINSSFLGQRSQFKHQCINIDTNLDSFMIIPIHTEVHVKTISARVRQGLNHNDLMFLWRKCFFQVFP